jgi:hypothetical protein
VRFLGLAFAIALPFVAWACADLRVDALPKESALQAVAEIACPNDPDYVLPRLVAQEGSDGSWIVGVDDFNQNDIRFKIGTLSKVLLPIETSKRNAATIAFIESMPRSCSTASGGARIADHDQPK